MAKQITNGDIVYFKKFQQSLRGSMPVNFSGMGVGLMLGHVPENGKDLTAGAAFRILGTCGFMKFDDVAEFLGEEQAKVCLEKFTDKYYGTKTATAPVDLEAVSAKADELSGRPKLIGINDDGN